VALAGALAVAEAIALATRPRGRLLAAPPVRAEDHFSAEEIARARRFVRPQLAIGLAGMALEGVVLASLVRRPPAPPAGLARRSLAAGAATGAALSLTLTVAGLPLAALARRRSLDAGLATQSWGGWAGDVAKSTALGTAFAGAGSALALELMRRLPRGWWIPGSGLAVAGGAVLLLAGPVLLDPLFNRFTPLPAGPARDDVLELARRAGVRVRQVYVVDASRRTTAANAYVTGLGPTKRVVLFDTLLNSFSPEETRLVVAHELAHVHYRDVPQALLHMAVTAPLCALAVARLTRRLTPAGEAGQAGEAEPEVLPGLALAVGLVATPVSLIYNARSRAVEARADAFALELTNDPAPFISFERRIALQNLADPDPPAWVARLLATHPTTVERIGIARAYEAGERWSDAGPAMGSVADFGAVGSGGERGSDGAAAASAAGAASAADGATHPPPG